jgi:GNAT superfamily N-acetyltransferase
LADVVARIEAFERLPVDPWLELVSPPSPGRAAVIAFPAHFVVAADVDRPWIETLIPAVDFVAPLGPPFLRALEERLSLTAGTIDAVLLAEPLAGDPPIDLTPVGDSDHPRVRRARRYRTDLRVWTTPHGVLMLGRGLAGRWEAAVEVDESARNRGLGRALAYAARHLVPDGRPVWGQVAPGNAGSLRAFLAAGYMPVGAEVLLTPP